MVNWRSWLHLSLPGFQTAGSLAMNPARLAAGCRVPDIWMTSTLTACGNDGADPTLSLKGAVMSVETARLSRIAQRIRLGRCRANAIASPPGAKGLKGIA